METKSVVKHKFVIAKNNLLALFCQLFNQGCVVCALHLSFKAHFLFCLLLPVLSFKTLIFARSVFVYFVRCAE